MSDVAEPIPFDRSLNARADAVQRMSPLVRRVIANNGGPYTFTGTCTYLVGHGDVTVVDPGPEDALHRAALLGALEPGERVAQILVTHSHRDHSPGAASLRDATGAPVIGCAPYRAPPSAPNADLRPADAAHDGAYAPDRVLRDGEDVNGPGYSLVAVSTPGHTANHLSFALPEEQALFTGDLVMAWSTTVVAPPDGSMRAFMASLDTLLGRSDAIYWPGHGGPVQQPQRFVRALAHHRRQREQAILARVRAGDSAVDVIVARLYADLAPALRGAACLSVLAHLESLIEQGRVQGEGAFGLKARFSPA
jgi:glyoxylase-like metal-dependent hydrolase (beta-lactamase superfamily II)